MFDTTDDVVVDFGAHYYPEVPQSTEFIAEFIESEDGEPIFTDFGTVLNRYEESGVDGAVFSQPTFMGIGDDDRVAQENDALREVVEPHDYYYSLASIPTAAGGEAAASEFERSLDQGHQGGALETKTDGIELVDDELEPVFEIADQTGAPILVHPKLDHSLHPEVLDDTWRLNAIFGRETALCESISKVIHEGVFDRYSNLTLVYHHSGGNIAGMLPRIHLQIDPGRWPGQEHVKSFTEFKHLLEKHIFVDTSGYFGYNRTMRQIRETFPARNVLFGTDFPYETRRPEYFRKIIAAIQDAAPSTDAAGMLGEYALETMVNV